MLMIITDIIWVWNTVIFTSPCGNSEFKIRTHLRGNSGIIKEGTFKNVIAYTV